MDFRSYLTLEVALTRRLTKAWSEQSSGFYSDIEDALEAGKYDLARSTVANLDMTAVGEQNRQYIKYLLLNCALFGAGMANKQGPSFLATGSHDAVLNQVVSTFLLTLEHNATDQVQTEALQLIAAAEKASKVSLVQKVLNWVKKNNPYHDAEGKFTDAAHAVGYGEWDGRAPIDIDTGYPEREYLSSLGKEVQDAVQSLPTIEVRGNTYSVNPLPKEPTDRSDAQQGAIKSALADKDWALTTVPMSSVYSRQSWVDGPKLVRMTAVKPSSLDVDSRYATAIQVDGRTVVIDGNHRAALALLTRQSHLTVRMLRIDKKVQKADRYVKNFTSFAKGGDDALQLVSSLNSSRLAVWGFTAEADVLGIERYRLTAVLDGRTSAFCRAVNGKTFEVESARSKINEVLAVQDPNDLKQVQPWPGQSKEEVAAYAGMSGDQLAALGLNIPPFHPGCRTLLVGVDEQVSSPSPRLEKPQDAVGATDTMATRDMFDEIGVEMTDEEIDHWNAYIRQDPVSILADLVGETPQEVLDGNLKGKSVSVSSSGDVTLSAKGVLDDGKYDVSAIVDPYAGTVYLTQADFVAGDSEAAESFLRNLYTSLISTGQKIGADALAVNSGEDAYTYAKLGFVPNALDWQHVRADILDELDGPQKALLEQLDDDQQAFLLNLLSNNNESAFQVLADLPWELNGEPIGKVLLNLNDVTLRLDLSDEEAVARAEAYLAP